MYTEWWSLCIKVNPLDTMMSNFSLSTDFWPPQTLCWADLIKLTPIIIHNPVEYIQNNGQQNFKKVFFNLLEKS